MNSLFGSFTKKLDFRKNKIVRFLFRLFIYFILLEAGLNIGSFIFSSVQEYQNRVFLKQKGVYRILCLGESTTRLGSRDSYPAQLEEILNQSKVGIKFKVINKGVGGTYTSYIVATLEENLNKYRPDMVITMMGDKDRYVFEADQRTSKVAIFFESLRTYKLAKLIWLHISAILGKTELVLPEHNNWTIDQLRRDIVNRKSQEISQADGLWRQEQAFKEAIKLHPKDDSSYVNLGLLYMAQGRYPEAEQALKQALALNPKNDAAYQGLNWFYVEHDKYAQAKAALDKAIQFNPNNDSTYLDFGRLYLLQAKYVDAGPVLEKAIQLNPKNDMAYLGLGLVYLFEVRYPAAEQVLKRASELNPRDDRAYGELAVLYDQLGNKELSRLYAQKANSLREQYYSPVTVNNYRRLKAILDQRKIKLVCVQYPVRSVVALKNIFPGQDGVAFVDNEKIFKDAIAKDGAHAYFLDMFGGDFGHCTPKGNRLLAENVARTVLKEAFGK